MLTGALRITALSPFRKSTEEECLAFILMKLVSNASQEKIALQLSAILQSRSESRIGCAWPGRKKPSTRRSLVRDHEIRPGAWREHFAPRGWSLFHPYIRIPSM